MGLTLGLDSALSGLLASQSALNVVSQNITNVNTPGYTRKLANLESVELNNNGAGVQLSSISRNVDSGLSQQINTQSSTMGSLNATANYYQKVESLFGTVGSGTSVADLLGTMASGFQQLASDNTQAANQTAAVQDAVSVTDQLNTMSSSVQSLRQQSDAQISSDVKQVNSDLNSLYDLNTKITRNLSVGADVTNLEDQRDSTLTDLSKYVAVKSYVNNQGALQVYTPSGLSLLDNEPHLLSHNAITGVESWMTLAGGQISPITIGSSPDDQTANLGGGEIGALVNLRDTTLPNMQSQLDTLAQQMQTQINSVANQGTNYPNAANSYTGSTIFANQGGVTVNTSDVNPTLTYNNGLGSMTSAGFGSLAFSYSTANGQPTITASNAKSLSSIAAGQTFSVTNATDPSNDGTYTVTSNDGTTMEVSRGNPVQTFSLANNADVMVGIFDSSGNPVSTTTLNTIMTTDYSTGGNNPTQPQLQAQASYGPWSMSSFTQHMQAWIQAQGSIYSAATVGMNANGQVSINLGSTVQQSLVFRDQASSTAGSAAQPATIDFDANGDGTTDQTVSGFSNFLGLNDLLVTNSANPVMDSAIQPSNFATTSSRILSLYDTTGQIGNTMTIPPGSSLNAIASIINAATATTESASQVNQSLTIATTANISVSNPSGVVSTLSLQPGTYTLQQIAAQLTEQQPGEVRATVVQTTPTTYALRLSDTNSVPLSVDITGGVINGNSTLGNQLNMTATNTIQAAVVPDGSGQRLRIVDSAGRQVYAAALKDGSGNSILTDLGLSSAAVDTASNISVNSAMQTNPQLIPQGSVQWNATTGSYYLSAGDSSTAQALAAAMTATSTMPAAGGTASGQYTFSSYASSMISTVSTDSANVTSQQTYQQTLTTTLQTQFSSTSGVNLDQEVTSLIDYQQAYTASARVISTLQQMLSTLVDIFH